MVGSFIECGYWFISNCYFLIRQIQKVYRMPISIKYAIQPKCDGEGERRWFKEHRIAERRDWDGSVILYYFTFVFCNIYTLVLRLNPFKTES